MCSLRPLIVEAELKAHLGSNHFWQQQCDLLTIWGIEAHHDGIATIDRADVRYVSVHEGGGQSGVAGVAIGAYG